MLMYHEIYVSYRKKITKNIFLPYAWVQFLSPTVREQQSSEAIANLQESPNTYYTSGSWCDPADSNRCADLPRLNKARGSLSKPPLPRLPSSWQNIMKRCSLRTIRTPQRRGAIFFCADVVEIIIELGIHVTHVRKFGSNTQPLSSIDPNRRRLWLSDSIFFFVLDFGSKSQDRPSVYEYEWLKWCVPDPLVTPLRSDGSLLHREPSKVLEKEIQPWSWGYDQ